MWECHLPLKQIYRGGWERHPLLKIEFIGAGEPVSHP